MSDYEAMEAMLLGPAVKEPMFRDSQPKLLTDTNNQSYSTGQINHDTRDLIAEYITFRNNSLLIPLSISLNTSFCSSTSNLGIVFATSAAGGVFTATSIPAALSNGVDPTAVAVNNFIGNNVSASVSATSAVIAFKTSILDLISGCTVSTGDQCQVLSELNSPKLINNVKLLVGKNLDWQTTYAQEYCFAKDTYPAINSTNVGFVTRANYLLNNSQLTYYVGTTNLVANNYVPCYITRIQTLIDIPLRDLHSFYDNMDSPMKGIRWLLNFYLCKELNSNSSYAGFVYNNTACAVPPNFWVGAGTGSQVAPNILGLNYNSTYIRYKTITLPYAFQERVSRLSLEGKLNTKIIKFALCELYDGNTLKNLTASLSSYQTTQGIVKPIRMWFWGWNVGAGASSTTLNNTTMYLQNLNIRINNTNRFTNSLQTPYDLFEQVREQMQCLSYTNDKGSLLNFSDYYVAQNSPVVLGPPVNSVTGRGDDPGMYALYCISLDRLQERTSDQAVSLILDSIRQFQGGSTTSGTACDAVVLVEREMVCALRFDNNRVDVVVGSNIA